MNDPNVMKLEVSQQYFMSPDNFKWTKNGLHLMRLHHSATKGTKQQVTTANP